jgi:transposase
MMSPTIYSPTNCGMRAVIRFLHAKNMSATEIHRKLCAVVYGQNVMSEETVREWCRMFRDGRKNIHGEERSGRPSAVSDDLVQSAHR